LKRQFDERIVETKRKISSRAFYIMLWGFLVVTLYRQFYLNQEFSDYGDYFIIWIAASFYVAFGEVLQGVNPFGSSRYKFWAVPLMMAGSILAVQIFQGTVVSFVEGVLTFVIALICSSVTLYVLFLLYRRWEKRNVDSD